MSVNPKVSIILPLYNYEKYIDACIQSCLAQDFKDFEVVIVDDCSTDNSYAKAQAWVAKDDRVKLFRQPENKMVAAAKNRGIIESRGEYIVHIDADDMLTMDSLTVRLDEIEKDTSVMMVHGRAYNFNGDKGWDWCLLNAAKMTIDYKTQIHNQCVMIRRECFDKYGLYDENLKNCDKEMWIRMRDLVKIKIVKMLVPVAFYRTHSKSLMAYRRKNKMYDRKVKKLLDSAVEMRRRDGITKNNTRFI